MASLSVVSVASLSLSEFALMISRTTARDRFLKSVPRVYLWYLEKPLTMFSMYMARSIAFL